MRQLLAAALVILISGVTAVAVRDADPSAPRALAAAVDPAATEDAPGATDDVTAAATPPVVDVVSGAVGADGPDCHTRASQRAPIERIAGSNRWATAVCASRFVYRQPVDTVVLARGDAAGGYADALAGAVLAAHVDGPVLLTAPDVLPVETSAELDRLSPRRVILLGGERAISPAVERAVRGHTTTVERLAGADRAGTAVRVASLVGPRDTAFVVNGYRPAHALVAAATAAREGAHLLLANDGSVPDSTIDALEGVTRISVVGDFAAVGEAAEASLRRLVGESHFERLGGPDRAEVAASVARAHPADGVIHLVSDNERNLVDALSAGWTAARPDGGPVLFSATNSVHRGTDRYLRLGRLDAATPVRLVGGEQVLSPALVSALEDRYDEAAQGGPAAQLRGFWVHVLDNSLKSRSGIDRVLDAAAGANLNTIVVQAARRHDAFYDSDVLPRTSDPKMPPGLDLLGRLVPAAHARGLDVHVWFSVMPTYHTLFDQETLPADHIHRLHGPNGSKGSWMAASVESNYGMLDPGIPGVQNHVAAMTREVVERYDVDGIHLDYLRYATGGSRMNPIAEERYRRVGGGMSLDDFRRRQTEDLARRVYLEVTAADPQVVLSMAAIAQGEGPTGSDLRASFRGTRAYREKFQDWPTWLDRGIMDMAFPMIYFQESRYAAWFDQWNRFLASLPAGIRAVGQGSYLNPTSASLAQIDDALRATHGAVLYSYQLDSTDGRGELLSSLASSRFRDPAPAPEVASKLAPTRGHVLAIAEDGRAVTATPAAGGTPVHMRTDATGRAGFVGLAPGRWTVSVQGGTPVPVEVVAGRVTTVDVR
ncbi:MAG: family 10 glycosylhydrolase [Actinobacteria bacterium]|nr:family 10 glycosylhydrolase [Actinomycetota bacterium]